MARHREVFPTSEIPHKWAHAAQDSARNPQGNLYFRGATLYSYRDSYPIARIYRKKNATLVLHVENTYSVTTAGHCHAARQAASHMPAVTVPYVDFALTAKIAHAENLEHLAKLAAAHFAKAKRVLSVRSAEWEISRARDAATDYATYCAFFGIRRKAPAIPDAEVTAALERVRKIENPDPASADKRERARARRLELAVEKARRRAQAAARAAQVYRTNWRLFGAFTGDSRMWDGKQPVMLRVNGEEIETSQGARIPLAAAPMVWSLVQRAIARGGWKPCGLNAVKIGDYAVSEVTADGTLIAGCHEIPHSELRMMARVLGLS